MYSRRIFVSGVVIMLFRCECGRAVSELADAVMRGEQGNDTFLAAEKGHVNAPQRDGRSTSSAARLDDLETADRLIRAGANDRPRRVPARRRCSSPP